ncbi:MAG: hypothetical protein ACOVP1_00245 [Bacteroidia bacterium]
MKKVVLGFILLTAISIQLKAQNEKGFIGISLGPSIPMGDLASKNINNNSAGFANTGAIFDISFAHKLGAGKFGITAILRGQSNPTDAQAMADELAIQSPGVNFTVESKNWGIGGFMFGGFASIPVSNKASFDTRVMIGFLSSTSPDITITGSGPGGSAWVKQGSTGASAFAYMFGAGFKFDIAPRLYLLTNLDYLGSKPEFRNVETTTSLGERQRSTWSQNIGTLNLSIGVALKI